MQLLEWILHGIKKVILTFLKTRIILFLVVRCMQVGLWVGDRHNHGKEIWSSSIQQNLPNSFQTCLNLTNLSLFIWFMEELILVKLQLTISSHLMIIGLLLRSKEDLAPITTLSDLFWWTIKMLFFPKSQNQFKLCLSLLENWLL